jgi:hypothetical protein
MYAEKESLLISCQLWTLKIITKIQNDFCKSPKPKFIVKHFSKLEKANYELNEKKCFSDV